MNHEPECPLLGVDICTYSTHPDWRMPTDACPSCQQRCICRQLRVAYLRGMEHAAKAADHRKDELGWCSKRDRCHTMSQGADLAASDIRWEAGKLRTGWKLP